MLGISSVSSSTGDTGGDEGGTGEAEELVMESEGEDLGDDELLPEPVCLLAPWAVGPVEAAGDFDEKGESPEPVLIFLIRPCRKFCSRDWHRLEQ